MVISLLALVLAGSAAGSAADDGCLSCHAHTATAAAHAALLPVHVDRVARCVECHRGEPAAAREVAAAHGNGPSALLADEAVAAACVGCHLAGSVAGTEPIVRGGRSYLERGCQLCHLGARGLGHRQAFGPPLTGIGARGAEYL